MHCLTAWLPRESRCMSFISSPQGSFLVPLTSNISRIAQCCTSYVMVVLCFIMGFTGVFFLRVILAHAQWSFSSMTWQLGTRYLGRFVQSIERVGNFWRPFCFSVSSEFVFSFGCTRDGFIRFASVWTAERSMFRAFFIDHWLVA
jgi:hypothetical protein